MIVLWVVLALFAGSALLARFQHSRGYLLWTYLWYRVWRMRERRRAWQSWMYEHHRWFAYATRPYYRVKNSELGWAVRLGFDKYWYMYASLFSPTCKQHKGVILMEGRCPSCMFRGAWERLRNR